MLKWNKWEVGTKPKSTNWQLLLRLMRRLSLWKIVKFFLLMKFWRRRKMLRSNSKNASKESKTIKKVVMIWELSWRMAPTTSSSSKKKFIRLIRLLLNFWNSWRMQRLRSTPWNNTSSTSNKESLSTSQWKMIKLTENWQNLLIITPNDPN